MYGLTYVRNKLQATTSKPSDHLRLGVTKAPSGPLVSA